MMKKLTLLLISLFLFAGISPAQEDAQSVTGTVTDVKLKKKLFIQVGALEKKDGDKYLLRKRSSHVEFYINDDASVFLKETGSIENIEEGNYIVVKGPKNNKVALANAIYIYKNKEEYDEFVYKGPVDRTEEKKKRFYSTLLEGTVVNPDGKFDRVDDLLRPIVIRIEDKTVEKARDREREKKKKMLEEMKAREEEENGEKIEEEEEKKEEEEKQEQEEEQEQDREEGLDYYISYDEDTYWVINRRVDKGEINLADRLKLYFDTRITIRYKSYPVKVIIDRAKVGY